MLFIGLPFVSELAAACDQIQPGVMRPVCSALNSTDPQLEGSCSGEARGNLTDVKLQRGPAEAGENARQTTKSVLTHVHLTPSKLAL